SGKRGAEPGAPAATAPSPVHALKPAQRFIRRAANSTDDEPSTPSSGPRKDPCEFVTAAEAQGILGSPTLDPIVAPMGPTCIYRTRNHRTTISVSVETLGARQLAATLRGMRKLGLAGHGEAYC